MKKIFLVAIAAVLGLTACEKENLEKGLEIISFELKVDHDKAPSKVSLLVERKVDNAGSYTISHQDAFKSSAGKEATDETLIEIKGSSVHTDTLEIYYMSGGTYNISLTNEIGTRYEKTITLAASNRELLPLRKWQLSKFLTTWHDESTTDIYSLLSDYVKDNYYIFYMDGTYKVDEGYSKGSPDDPQIVQQGTWEYVSPRQDSIMMYWEGNTTLWQELVVDEDKISCKRISEYQEGENTVNAVNQIEYIKIK